MENNDSELLRVLRNALEEEDGLCLDNEHERDHLVLSIYDAITQNFSVRRNF